MPNPKANQLVSLSQGDLEYAMSASKGELEAKISLIEGQLATLRIIHKARKFPGGAKKVSATNPANEGVKAAPKVKAAKAEPIDLNDPVVQAEIASGVRGPSGKKRRADFGKPKGPRKGSGDSGEEQVRSTGEGTAEQVAQQLAQAPVPAQPVAEVEDEGDGVFMHPDAVAEAAANG